MTNQINVGINPQKILQVASKIFNATMRDILIELLQNCRRAQANNVWINSELIKEGLYRVMVKDDGNGFSLTEDSITLGGSNWNEEIQEQEDPAGMGLFSLAKYGCIIESKGIKAVLEPKHFQGLEPIDLESSKIQIGTQITFECPYPQNWSFNSIFCSYLSQHYYPFELTIDDQPWQRIEYDPKSQYHELYEGIEIHVFEGNNRPIVNQSYGYDKSTINFFGLLIPIAPIVLSESNGVRNYYYQVFFNVKNCHKLELVLPARKEIVKNEFYHQLVAEAKKVIYRYIAQSKQHYLLYKDYQAAKKVCPDIKEAAPCLPLYYPYSLAKVCGRDANAHLMVGQFYEIPQTPGNSNNIILLDQYLIAEMLDEDDFWVNHFDFFAQLCKALLGAGCTLLIDRNGLYEGYSWYKKLPKITSAQIEACFSESEESLMIYEYSYEYDWYNIETKYLINVKHLDNIQSPYQCSEIKLAVKLSNYTELNIYLDYLFLKQNAVETWEIYPNLIDVIWAKPITSHQDLPVGELIEYYYFCDEDSERDEDIYFKEYEDAAIAQMTLCYFGEQRNDADILKDWLSEQIGIYLPYNGQISFTIESGEITDLTVHKPNP